MSSYDIAVWYSSAALNNAQAAEYYRRLGATIIVVEHRPEFDAFLREVVARFADRGSKAAPVSPDAVPYGLLETWDDLLMARAVPSLTPAQTRDLAEDFEVFERSPWAASLNANGDSMTLPFRWDRAEAFVPILIGLARQHGLTVYDPQSRAVSNPERPALQDAAEFLTLHLTLRLEGQPPAVDTTLAYDGLPVLHEVLPDRAAAHAVARRVALERHVRAYEVADPRSLAQGTRYYPVTADTDPFGAAMTDVLRGKGFETYIIGGPDGPKPQDAGSGASQFRLRRE